MDVEYQRLSITYPSFPSTRLPRWLLYHHAKNRRLLTHFKRICTLAAISALVSIFVCGLLYPSYTNPPARYKELRDAVEQFGHGANKNNEKIFIAASLYDDHGKLLDGEWGRAVLGLIDILGHDNVFLSIYQNDADDQAALAIDKFAQKVQCQSSIVTEHLDLASLPHVQNIQGKRRLKRISFLAEVRNRALGPLNDAKSTASRLDFDKILYLNDVYFDPIDAANLLFSTNVDQVAPKPQYHAACAVDFINPFKFYDTFATRDAQGYGTGVPFYPWFTDAGNGQSRRDVLDQKDAVRVKSCWGGMVAFQAKWFLSSNLTAGTKEPLRFRAETDPFWESSECCLIHADLTAMDPTLSHDRSGVYLNPYVRVAYSQRVLAWLSFTKRFERLYVPFHTLVNRLSGRPLSNTRQFHQPGQMVQEEIWQSNHDPVPSSSSSSSTTGSWIRVQREARPGGFCGMRKLSFINEDANKDFRWAKDDVSH